MESHKKQSTANSGHGRCFLSSIVTVLALSTSCATLIVPAAPAIRPHEKGAGSVPPEVPAATEDAVPVPHHEETDLPVLPQVQISIAEDTSSVIPDESAPTEYVRDVQYELNDQVRILIDKISTREVRKSPWLKDPSTIEFLDANNELLLVAKVNPGSGQIIFSEFDYFPLSVFMSDSLQQSNFIQLPSRIKRYNVGLILDDPASNNHVLFRVKVGRRVEFRSFDLLIIPLARVFFNRTVTLQVFREEPD